MRSVGHNRLETNRTQSLGINMGFFSCQKDKHPEFTPKSKLRMTCIKVWLLQYRATLSSHSKSGRIEYFP